MHLLVILEEPSVFSQQYHLITTKLRQLLRRLSKGHRVMAQQVHELNVVPLNQQIQLLHSTQQNSL